MTASVLTGDAPPPVAAPTSRWRIPLRVAPAQLVWLAAAIILVILVVLPIGAMAWRAVTDDSGAFTLANLADAAASPRLRKALVNTLLVGFGTAIGSVLVATPLAFGVARTNMRFKSLVKISVIVSFISPPFLIALSYILIGGPNVGYVNRLLRWMFGLETEFGPFNIYSLYGFLFLALPGTVALVFLTLVPTFSSMDPALEEASRVTGGTSAETIRLITLPMLKPAILSGGLLSFSVALAIFGTPYILGIDVLTTSIRQAILVDFDFGMAATLSVVISVLSMIMLALYRRTTKMTKRYETIRGKGYRPTLIRMGFGRHVLSALGLTYALLAAFLPYILLLLIAFMESPTRGLVLDNLTLDNFRFVFAAPIVREGFTNSLILSGVTATVVAILAIVIGYIVVKTKVVGRSVLDYIAIAPIGIAGTAFAVGMMVAYLFTPAKVLSLYGTIWLLMLAYAGRYITYGVRSVQVSLVQVSTELEEAARVSGASQLRALATVTIPLVRQGIAYSWILVFIQTFPELSTSIMLRAPGSEVAATALLNLWDGPNGLPRASAVAILIFVAVMALVALAQRVGGRPIASMNS